LSREPEITKMVIKVTANHSEAPVGAEQDQRMAGTIWN
jgi:hypothetical protein